jgi:HNH endonuclease
MPRCIYCSKDKAPLEFNREHVLNQAFGRFETNLVLRCVCESCNQELGDTVDLILGRDSMEGYDRIATGVKNASDFKPMGRKGMTRIEFAKDGPLRGALGYAIPSKSGDGIGSTVIPCIGFSRTEDGDPLWFPLDAIPPKADLGALLGIQAGERVYMRTAGMASQEKIQKALERAGLDILSHEWTGKRAPYQGVVTGETVFKLQRPHFRALTKIALNYLAAVAGAEVALLPAFDGARRFARFDEGPRIVEVPRQCQRNPSRCHYVCVQTVRDRVVAHVSLLMRVMYYSVTLAASGFDSRISSAHLFDLEAKSLTETEPVDPDEPLD